MLPMAAQVVGDVDDFLDMPSHLRAHLPRRDRVRCTTCWSSGARTRVPRAQLAKLRSGAQKSLFELSFEAR